MQSVLRVVMETVQHRLFTMNVLRGKKVVPR